MLFCTYIKGVLKPFLRSVMRVGVFEIGKTVEHNFAVGRLIHSEKCQSETESIQE